MITGYRLVQMVDVSTRTQASSSMDAQTKASNALSED